MQDIKIVVAGAGYAAVAFDRAACLNIAIEQALGEKVQQDIETIVQEQASFPITANPILGLAEQMKKIQCKVGKGGGHYYTEQPFDHEIEGVIITDSRYKCSCGRVL